MGWRLPAGGHRLRSRLLQSHNPALEDPAYARYSGSATVGGGSGLDGHADAGGGQAGAGAFAVRA